MAQSPDDGAVPDADTALRIGMEAIASRFGAKVLEEYEPYRASLLHGNWFVSGTSNAHREAAELRKALGSKAVVVVRGGGQPGASIAADDGRILSVSYQK